MNADSKQAIPCPNQMSRRAIAPVPTCVDIPTNPDMLTTGASAHRLNVVRGNG